MQEQEIDVPVIVSEAWTGGLMARCQDIMPEASKAHLPPMLERCSVSAHNQACTWSADAFPSMSRPGAESDTLSGFKPRNIIFLHPDLGIGGAERLIVDAAVGLQDLGHKVTIFTSHCDPRHCFEEARDGTFETSHSVYELRS